MSIELVDLELTDPAAPAGVSARHAWVRMVVRVRATPIGVVARPNRGADLSTAELVADALEQLGRRAWARVALDAPEEPRQDELPGITVIVCTRDRAERLDGCLEALSLSRYPRADVLVVDNAPSDDAARAVAERWSAGYVREPRPGLDRARNRGLAEARAPIVAFTDDDARPEPGWLDGLARGFDSPDVLAVTGLVLPAELETRAQVQFEELYGGMGKGYELRVVSRRAKRMIYRPEQLGLGCNMAFRREALDRLGGFDPALDVATLTGGGGDLDAFQRVLETGGALVYRPDAVVRHHHRRSQSALRRQLFDNGRGYSAVLFAALLRARGTTRLHVVGRYWRWIYAWHLRRIALRVLRRERLPLRLLLAELAGAPLGPFVYLRARAAARSVDRASRGAAR